MNELPRSLYWPVYLVSTQNTMVACFRLENMWLYTDRSRPDFTRGGQAALTVIVAVL